MPYDRVSSSTSNLSLKCLETYVPARYGSQQDYDVFQFETVKRYLDLAEPGKAINHVPWSNGTDLRKMLTIHGFSTERALDFITFLLCTTQDQPNVAHST